MKNIVYAGLMSPMTRFSFSHAIQQPSNMRKFFKQCTFIENPKPAHPLHRYQIFNRKIYHKIR